MKTPSIQFIKQLRDDTLAPMMLCKKALESSDWDLDKAKTWLREQGQTLSETRASRQTNEGRLYMHQLTACNGVFICKIYTQTDFVANSDVVNDFANLIGPAVECVYNSYPCQDLSKSMKVPMELVNGINAADGWSSDRILSLKIADDSGTIGDKLNHLMMITGEKITVSDGILIHGLVTSGFYLHSTKKVGSIIFLNRCKSTPIDVASGIARDVAMHHTAMNPAYISYRKIPMNVYNHNFQIYRESFKRDLKFTRLPESKRASIIAEKVVKYLLSQCLLSQIYVKDSSVTVDEYIRKSIPEDPVPTVTLAIRFELNEEDSLASTLSGYVNPIRYSLS